MMNDKYKMLLNIILFVFLIASLVFNLIFFSQSKITQEKIYKTQIEFDKKLESFANEYNDSLIQNNKQLGELQNNLNQRIDNIFEMYSNFSETNDKWSRAYAEIGKNVKVINSVNDKISTLNTTYENILNEERRKTHFPNERVEIEVTNKRKEAELLFAREQYTEALLLLNEIAGYYIEDKDYIFMHTYSLFKHNPMDSSQYENIKNIFTELELNGYRRKEIPEVLEYIANETMQ